MLVRGSLVKRGLDWQWGMQDLHGRGVVQSTVLWGRWAYVRWEAGGTHAYRWGVQGLVDIVVVTAAVQDNLYCNSG